MTHDTVLIKANLVLPHYTKRGKSLGGLAHDTYLGVQNGVITHAGPLPFGDLGRQPVTDLTGHYISPGLIDLQVNGGGGKLFNDATTFDDLHIIINAHKNFGTTGLLATLMCDAADQLERQIAFIADAIANDDLCRRHILGIHLEGPFFNPERRGAHPLHCIALPDAIWMKRWIDAAKGSLKIVTLAPELPGALDVIRFLKDNGIRVSLAHSEADYDQGMAGIAAGATLGTHVFNTMPQLQSRAPGLTGALLDGEVSISLINDGHHVHDAALRIALRAKGLTRSFFVSDAMHILGLDADVAIDYRGELMQARNGAVINARGRFAGSAAPLLTALQRAVTHLGLNIADAVRLCSQNPAKILNLLDRGQLKTGLPADFIILSPDLIPVPHPSYIN